MDVNITLEWHLIQSIATSLALGAIVGLERQSHGDVAEHESMGVRTFALVSLLGTLAVLAHDVAPALTWIAGMGFLLLIGTFLVSELRASNRKTGITTEVAALLVFLLGALVPVQPVLSASIAVIVALILSIKTFTHRWVGRLTQREIFDTLKFLLVTVVLLPLLPNHPVDPWQIYNPRELWFLVVLISGISFLGYFAMRFLGSQRGILVTGLIGGLASSTAVTLAMAQQMRDERGSRRVLFGASFAILIANAIMIGRVGIEVAVINPRLLVELWLPLLAMAVGGLGSALWLWTKLAAEVRSAVSDDAGVAIATDALDADDAPRPPLPGEDDSHVHLKNPFRLVPAIKFGLVFVVIIALVHIAQGYLGSMGTYVAALISGLADVDAIALALARMQNVGEITSQVAGRSIVIAVLANSFVKAALSALLGTARLGALVAMAMIPTLVLGMVAAMFI
ncbi:MAG: MgtC/SapB family protein [Bradymonadaceae bacterium]|nr:MgtC/SapB family protein [Lujinxingiaceae bacterium]